MIFHYRSSNDKFDAMNKHQHMIELLLTTVIYHRKQNNLVPDALRTRLEAKLLKKNKSCSIQHQNLEPLAV